MKSLARFTTVAALALTFAAVSASAGTVNIYFQGPGNSDGGVGTYPYVFTINGQNVNLLCDNYTNHIVAGESWDATTHDIFSAPHQFDLGVLTDRTYEEAAYIFLEILANPGNATFSNAANFAIWGLFDPTTLTNGAYGADGSALIAADAAANAPLDHGFYTHVVLYTPTGTNINPPDEGTPQEFFGHSDAPLIPEPASLTLLGTGMLGLGAMGRKLWA